MAYSLDDLYGIATGLVDLYQPRNDLYTKIDEMFNLEWTMVEGVPDWVLPVVSTDPRDAVTTTVRTFATVVPYFRIMPMLNNQANRDRANEIETAIGYNFRRAAKRTDSSIVWDVMLSSALYADVAAEVIYLPYQEKILEAMGKNTKRVKAAKRFGDYAFVVHHPSNHYPEWSEYGMEGVLTIRVQTVDEFKYSWGNLSEKIVDEKDYQDGNVSYVTSFDYKNYENRCVWGVMTDSSDQALEGHGIKILEEENEMGFIPFVSKRWGNSLSSETDKRVMPLLQSIRESGQWDMLNVFESLDSSLTIKRAAQPQFAAETPPGQDIEMDNTEPAGVAYLPQGTRQFTPLPAQSVDQRVMMQKNQKKSEIWQTTVAKMLQSLEFSAGTPAASVNQLLSQATNSLSPYKILAQNTLEEISHSMLCWGKYYSKTYKDDSVSLWGRYGEEDKSRTGQEISIPFKSIDPDLLEIEVTLTADKPVDKLQLINGAVLTKQNFPVPDEELMEEMGYNNPAELTKRRKQQDMRDAYLAADLARIQQRPQLEAQQETMQMQMGMQQQAQSQQMEQEMAAREQEAAMAAAANGEAPAQENAGGLGNNPAAGGQAPQPNMGV